MTQVPPVHLAVMQPPGYPHSLGFVDQARYLRYQFRRFGAEVTMAKNRLREDAVNIVFGAHLGFPEDWTQRHACIFMNLEQLGQGGAKVNPAYMRLLRTSAVADYDPLNVPAYCSDPADVPVVPFLHAPYLDRGLAPALEDRPIDLLFFGSLNDRRRAFIERVEACGATVALFDKPIYCEERDQFIRQAKAVLNCSFYDAARFEQVRVSHCLSLGTPVISERHAASSPPAAFEDAVFWLGEGELEGFFKERFARPEFFAQARQQLEAFARHDPVEAYADLLAFATGFFQGHQQHRQSGPWRPTQVNLGSGKDYKPGWLNIDVLDRAEPDVVLDLGQPVEWPVRLATRYGGEVLLEPGSVQLLYANNVLEHVPDLPTLMTNALALLKEGGEFEIEVPYEHSRAAWQDPTHLRAMNENSWLYYTEWFWYLGWFEHRFEVVRSHWLNAQLKPCEKADASFMKVRLRKIETTLNDRTTARTMRADFGGIDDDLPPARPEPVLVQREAA
nr:methyltransferase domain-containing protein [uncultured Caldimonas sp.]